MDQPIDAVVYDRLTQAHAFLDCAFVRDMATIGVQGGLVLDVGCGSGRLPIILTQALPGLRVVAVDISSAMLSLARVNSGKNETGWIEFLRADAELLPFDSQMFDLVVSHHTVHHLSEPVNILREMQRVLRPGGTLFVRDLRRPDHAVVISLYLATAGRIYNKLGGDSVLGKRLYRDSLAAALNRAEWASLAMACGIQPQSIATHWFTSHQDMLWRKPL